MSTTYKLDDKIPDEILTARVQYLIDCITGKVKLSDSGFRSEFSMRVPAELDRDADLVLSELLKRLERLRRVEEQHNNLRTAAANLIVYLEFGSDHREMLSKLKAALEEK